jgi:outer membrane protein assembly factor BamE (lipoprotein component of BamABCDE complex)
MRNRPRLRRAAPFLVCAAVLGASPGCGILARQQKEHRIDPAALGNIKKGMEKSEVTNLLGAPQEIIFSNKEHDPLREHAYVYQYERTYYTAVSFAIINFGNMDTKKDRVMVFFDDAGRVDHVGASLHADEAAYNFPFGR